LLSPGPLCPRFFFTSPIRGVGGHFSKKKMRPRFQPIKKKFFLNRNGTDRCLARVEKFFLAMKTNMATSWAPCCVCVGERIWKAVRRFFFFPLACRPRAPSLSDAVGGLGTLSRLASWSSATSRAAAPRGAPFFFLGGAVGPVTLPSCPVSPSPCGGKAGSEMDHKDLESSNRCPGHKFTTCKYFSNTLYGAFFSL
jgi:hypothetical protein